jgi:S-adenosylmethionine synthetase
MIVTRAPLLPEPDAKSQVTLRFVDGKPVAATAIVVSTQHAPGYDEGAKGAELQAYVKKTVTGLLPEGFVTDATVWHINPTGSFEIGGPDGDAGVTGRKIIVDTYGGAAPHGGGASRARTRRRLTARRPMSRVIWPRMSLPPALPSA